jgi:hypothetical protein
VLIVINGSRRSAENATVDPVFFSEQIEKN